MVVAILDLILGELVERAHLDDGCSLVFISVGAGNRVVRKNLFVGCHSYLRPRR